MCRWGFHPGLRQPGLFTTKDCIKCGTLSRVLGSWVAGPFCFQGAWENWKTIEGNWGLLEENTLNKEKIFRELGRKVIFLLVSLELIPSWMGLKFKLTCFHIYPIKSHFYIMRYTG